MKLRRWVVPGLFLSGAVHAAGFAIDVQGARATGMGGAFATLADDASAIFYNPAGVVGGTGLDLQIGDSLILPNVSFTQGGRTTSTEFIVSTPAHVFARYAAHERIGLGLGFFSPFGSSSRWPQGWPGRFRSTSSQVATYYLQPTVAIQLHDYVDAGVVVHLVRGSVQLERDLNFLDSTGHATLGGAAWGWGMDVGAQVKLIRGVLDFGVAWRQGVELDFDGRVHFEGEPLELENTLQDQGVSSTIRLPETFQAGLAAHISPQLRAAFEAKYTAWSSIRSLDFKYELGTLDSSQPKSWHDTVSLHLGGEFDVSRALQLRAGVVWDPSPSPAFTLSPDLPDSPRLKVTFGAGYAFGAARLDAGYQLVVLTGATSSFPDFPGEYSGLAHVVGVTFGYHLGG